MFKPKFILTTCTFAVVLALSALRTSAARAENPTDASLAPSITDNIVAELKEKGVSISSVEMVAYQIHTAPTTDELENVADQVNSSESKVVFIFHEHSTVQQVVDFLSDTTDLQEKTVVFITNNEDPTASLEKLLASTTTFEPGAYVCTPEGTLEPQRISVG